MHKKIIARMVKVAGFTGPLEIKKGRTSLPLPAQARHKLAGLEITTGFIHSTTIGIDAAARIHLQVNTGRPIVQNSNVCACRNGVFMGAHCFANKFGRGARNAQA